jgi:hypothetical protein
MPRRPPPQYIDFIGQNFMARPQARAAAKAKLPLAADFAGWFTHP